MDNPPNFFTALSLIVAPAVLTNASSVMVMSTSNRLARAVDRARDLTAKLEEGEQLKAPPDAVQLRELTAAEQRMLMLIRALRIFYVALGGFACAALLSLIGAAIAAVNVKALTTTLEVLAIGAGSIAVGALLHGAQLLVRETRIAVSVMHERASRLKDRLQQRQEGAGGEKAEDELSVI
jgi:hypothetical protein